MRFLKIWSVCFILATFLITVSGQEVIRKAAVSSQCGSIIEGEFTTNFDEHPYIVTMAPGDKIRASVTPLGDLLQVGITIVGPTGIVISRSDEDGNYVNQESQPSTETNTLSGRGQYTIFVRNYTASPLSGNAYSSRSDFTGGTGIYTLFIGCTLRDSTLIEPGDSQSSTSNTVIENTSDSQPSIPILDPNIYGFPGLPPVDFTNGVTIPLVADALNTGSISTGFEGIFGFSFSANQGQSMTLNFARMAGNLNLGVVLLSADNQVAFQASLVTSNTLSTELTIPASGEYTLGVFRIELIPPDAPENTTFTLTASLN